MPDQLITIDGSLGEGGGQVLRTSLSLAAALGLAVRVVNVRANRDRPGLRPQHLAAVRAAAAVCGGTLQGDAIGSRDLTLRPGEPRGGVHRFDIGTAGSSTLVLQTVLPALLLAGGESDVTVTGGTHNPLAPSFEYLRDVFGVLVAAAGVDVHLEMARAGFYPGGGGEVRMRLAGVASVDDLATIRFNDRGDLRAVEVLSAASFSLPAHIIDRQAHHAGERLLAAGHRPRVTQQVWETVSPGTAVFVRAVFARGVAGWCSLGARGKPAETVADEAVDAFLAFLASGGAVDSHAADQILTIAALCPGESRFTAQAATTHLATNADVIRQIVGRDIDISPADRGAAVVTVKAV